MKKRLIFFIIVAGAVFFLISFPFYVVLSGKRTVYPTVESVEPRTTAIVFGGGLNRDGTPSDALSDRLRIAVELYRQKKAERLLVSGDNRYHNYNEPKAMADFLVAAGIPESAIESDYAGRRTYDTC